MKCNFCIQADCRMYRCSEIIYERGKIAKDLHPIKLIKSLLKISTEKNNRIIFILRAQ